MKIADILIFENKYLNAIILHKEGLFWRAYKKSAFIFTQNIKAFKLTKKFLGISKYAVKTNDFSIGENSIDITITKALSLTTISEKIRNYLIIAKTPIECQQFLIELQTEINGTI